MAKKKLNLILEGLSEDDVQPRYCVVPISLGQSYHNGIWLKETMRLLVNQHFKKITVIVCDTLQRHTRKIGVNSFAWEEIEADLAEESAQWRNQLKNFIFQEGLYEKVTFKIQTWDFWREKDVFKEMLQKVTRACYELLPSFIKKVENAIESEDLWHNKDSFKEKLKIAIIDCYEDEQLENFVRKIDGIISRLEIEDVWNNKDSFKEKFKNILFNGYEGKQSSFGRKVGEAVEGYLRTRSEVFYKVKKNSEKQNPFTTKEAKELSIAYVLEESAVTLMWREEMNFNYEVYPQWPNPAIRAVAEQNDLSNCNPLKNLRIFNAKKQTSPPEKSTKHNHCYNESSFKNIVISDELKINVTKESLRNGESSIHLPIRKSLSPSFLIKKDGGSITFFGQQQFSQASSILEDRSSENLENLPLTLRTNIDLFRQTLQLHLQFICQQVPWQNVPLKSVLVSVVSEELHKVFNTILPEEGDKNSVDLSFTLG